MFHLLNTHTHGFISEWSPIDVPKLVELLSYTRSVNSVIQQHFVDGYTVCSTVLMDRSFKPFSLLFGLDHAVCLDE